MGGNWILHREAQVRGIIKWGKIIMFHEIAAQEGVWILNGWRYAQLAHFIASLPRPLRDEAEYRPIEKLFSKDMKKGKIAAIYRILVRELGAEPPPFIRKWEEELGASVDSEKVKRILEATHGTPVDSKTRESNYKCLTRWYMTPVRVSAFSPDKSPNCWRGCATPGSMSHLWWECPKIKNFWQEVIKIIEVITGKAIPFDPWDCLFHRSEGGMRWYKTSIIPVLLNSAKNIIPKKWQKQDAPRIGEWVANVNETYALERFEASNCTGSDNDTQGGKWDCWANFRKEV